jgi:photosystem II stability/assembly factor-like uncharacterized protein
MKTIGAMLRRMKIWMGIPVWIAFFLVAHLSFVPAGTLASWKSIGPEGGEVTAMGISQSSPDSLLVGGYYGWVFKSSNGGGKWEGIHPTAKENYVYVAAFDPANPNVVYASKYSEGLFKSTDGGNTWFSIGRSVLGEFVVALAIDPGNPNILYAAANQVFKSLDGGLTWQEKNTGSPYGQYSCFAIYPPSPNILYAGSMGMKIFKTENGGDTWTAVGLDLPGWDIIALAVHPTDPNRVYAAVWDYGVFKTVNGGDSWAAANNGLTDFHVLDLIIDPYSPNTLYAATYSGVFKTMDGGENWFPINNGLQGSGVRRLAIHPTNPNILYAGTEGRGVFKTLNGGATWIPVNTGLIGMDVILLLLDPLSPQRLYALSELSGLLKTTDGGGSWVPINQGLPLIKNDMVVDPLNPNLLYAATNEGVYKSEDGGETWFRAGVGIPDINNYISAIAIDPVNSATLYAGIWNGGNITPGLNDLYKSTDGGRTWTPMAAGLYNFFQIVIDPHNPQILYAGHLGEFGAALSKSWDGGRNWSVLGYYPISSFLCMAIDPKNPQVLYVADEALGLFKSSDGGWTYESIQNGLGTARTLSLAVDPVHPQIVYAGTDEGIFRSVDGGAHWEPFNDGLPLLAKTIRTLVVDPKSSGTLYAGTHALGAFRAGEAAKGPTVLLAINCGGPQYIDRAGVVYLADTYFSGGLTYRNPVPISGTEEDPLYQTERFGNFSYHIPLPNGNYQLTLKFAEIYPYIYSPGGRIFSVKVEGKEVIQKLDLFAKAGKYRAYDVTLPVTVADGVLNIEFKTEVNSAKINAILLTDSSPVFSYTITASATEGGTVNPAGAVPVNFGESRTFTIIPDPAYHIVNVKVDGESQGPLSTYTFEKVTADHTLHAIFEKNGALEPPVFAVNCGGPKYVDQKGRLFAADIHYSGGQTYGQAVPIEGTEDDFLYQSERYGNFSYQIPLPNGKYRVTLKFAEIYAYLSGPGKRIFDVKIEGNEVIRNLDLFAQAGKYRAYDVTIPVTVSDGILQIEFKTDVNAAKVNAILVEKD